MQKKLETLTDDRKYLRNKLRRNISEVESAEVKAAISQISQRLSKLRKEISLCDDIAAHSHIVENNIEQIVADEEKQKQNIRQRRKKTDMYNGGDAAEQIVRLSLEGFQVAAKSQVRRLKILHCF